ncbi:MAG TPA: hypothetical protein VIF62_17070 [Labilithrix sp.]|jgi:hypothetical protein
MNLTRVAVVLCCLSSLAACDLLKKKDADAGVASADDASAAATDAAATPAATTGTGATNENDVARFPDETALASVAATTKRFANLRVSPGTGGIVQGLNAGTAVTELASRQTFFLVTVADATGAKKLGWVANDAFVPAVLDAGLHPPTCTSPEVPLMGDVPFCGKKCGGDVDCPAGQACKGTAQAFSGQVLQPGTVAVCTVVARPGVAVTPVAPTPTVAARGDISPPPCVVGTHQLRDGQCHRNCVPGVRFNACAGSCLRCENQNVCVAGRTCP